MKKQPLIKDDASHSTLTVLHPQHMSMLQAKLNFYLQVIRELTN